MVFMRSSDMPDETRHQPTVLRVSGRTSARSLYVMCFKEHNFFRSTAQRTEGSDFIVLTPDKRTFPYLKGLREIVPYTRQLTAFSGKQVVSLWISIGQTEAESHLRIKEKASQGALIVGLPKQDMTSDKLSNRASSSAV